MIRRSDFIKLLWNSFEGFFERPAFENQKSLLHYGRKRYWLEDCDESDSDAILDRRNAARICHQFMKIELGIKDLDDVSRAGELKDLYTCRVCTPHVAQIYCRGIMDADFVEDDRGNSFSLEKTTCQTVYVKIFNHLELVEKDEAEEIVEQIKCLANNLR